MANSWDVDDGLKLLESIRRKINKVKEDGLEPISITMSFSNSAKIRAAFEGNVYAKEKEAQELTDFKVVEDKVLLKTLYGLTVGYKDQDGPTVQAKRK